MRGLFGEGVASMQVVSVREQPECMKPIITYFQDMWGTPESKKVYEDCINNSISTINPLPHWYVLMEKDKIIGCAGLITNDFISRMDLYPWLCAVYIEPEYRGHHYFKRLLDKAVEDTRAGGFNYLYVSTDLEGYYEQYGFTFLDVGYHPWGESSRIYFLTI